LFVLLCVLQKKKSPQLISCRWSAVQCETPCYFGMSDPLIRVDQAPQILHVPYPSYRPYTRRKLGFVGAVLLVMYSARPHRIHIASIPARILELQIRQLKLRCTM